MIVAWFWQLSWKSSAGLSGRLTFNLRRLAARPAQVNRDVRRQATPMGSRAMVLAPAHSYVEIFHQPIMQRIHPAVNCKILTTRPGVLHEYV